MHNDFTVFSRMVPSGKKVMYYYAYDENGDRRGPWTTGQTSKTAAKNYCHMLIRKGKLIPGSGEVPTFAEYAKGWWKWDTCAYLKDRRKRFNLTPSYAVKCQSVLENQLLPYFGKMKLDKITAEVIDEWFDKLSTPKKDERKYKNTTINGYYTTLITMLKWAVKKRVISRDPTLEITKLVDDRRAIEIITPKEFKALFITNWRKVWGRDRILYTANKLSALTGMRISEVLGLRGEFVFDDHIFVCAQYDQYGYRPTKTKDKSNIPLVPEMIADLRELMTSNGQGFLFSVDGGATPVCNRTLLRGLHEGLRNIGIDEPTIAKRGLTFHAWRHFCNTELLKAGLSIPQVQAVTRHKSVRMTEWYNHFDASDFAKVPSVQAGLLAPETESQNNEPEIKQSMVLRLVKPEQEQEQKMA